MTNNISSPDVLRMLKPGGKALPFQVYTRRNELPNESQKYLHVLGPTPKRCLETLVDLGLSDSEIARYFRIPKDIVTDFRQVWKIHGESSDQYA